MPKVYLTESQRRFDTFKMLVDVNMAKKRIKPFCKLFKITIMNQNTWYKRKSIEDFRVGELISIFSALDFSDEEILAVMKPKR